MFYTLKQRGDSSAVMMKLLKEKEGLRKHMRENFRGKKGWKKDRRKKAKGGRRRCMRRDERKESKINES